MKKILIVEDDKRIAVALGARLRAEGYATVNAHDGVMGVAAAVKEKPDLILLDISMPAGDGLTVAERLQGLTPTAGVPIIFMTASKVEGLEKRARELGAADFLEKPYEASRLLESINRALSSDANPGEIFSDGL